jgi:hypothetical protein
MLATTTTTVLVLVLLVLVQVMVMVMGGEEWNKACGSVAVATVVAGR